MVEETPLTPGKLTRATQDTKSWGALRMPRCTTTTQATPLPLGLMETAFKLELPAPKYWLVLKDVKSVLAVRDTTLSVEWKD
jgi:hypothetical protein